jgi:hypothetical protein
MMINQAAMAAKTLIIRNAGSEAGIDPVPGKILQVWPLRLGPDLIAAGRGGNASKRSCRKKQARDCWRAKLTDQGRPPSRRPFFCLVWKIRAALSLDSHAGFSFDEKIELKLSCVKMKNYSEFFCGPHRLIV